MRTLVFGGRDYGDRQHVWDVLDGIHSQTPISEVIEGGATGADSHARSWAGARDIPVLTYMAEWKRLGRGAGPIRNRRMLDEGQPELGVQFPGGRGTADMASAAHKRGLRVIVAIGKSKRPEPVT